MGLEKFVGEYTEAMTEPAGWPDVDESVLQERAAALLKLSNQVQSVAKLWQDNNTTLFDGGNWAGNGANAAHQSMRNRISQMNALADHLGKAYAYYNFMAGLVEEVKATINRNLKHAHQVIQDLKDSEIYSEGTKQALINMYVAWQNMINSGEVTSVAGRVIAFSAWTPPPSSIPAAAPTPPQQQSPQQKAPTPFGSDNLSAPSISPISHVRASQSPGPVGGDTVGAPVNSSPDHGPGQPAPVASPTGTDVAPQPADRKSVV